MYLNQFSADEDTFVKKRFAIRSLTQMVIINLNDADEYDDANEDNNDTQ